ncbi:helix-turn-helix transcriptional regulator [Flavobacterium sp. MAH-1]|uniref:Helix-turn-helix transcriptional regulator n=1 Tax=Flavobacterium agri TaxID=2743471 RepID=A0A7Y8XZ77_9FLAO|nr:helix-turn-helix transcriptional regulator [Flavobacterium agri]NUY79619.1 helix-turn-helix transcriptional regulator [Flavobacterium agri]NYA69644.1 helix-turn-helix transcriptional regulator [Flavobacterium agri]
MYPQHNRTGVPYVNKFLADSGECLLGLRRSGIDMSHPTQFSEYAIFFVHQGEGVFYSDLLSMPFRAPVILFASPMQVIGIQEAHPLDYSLLRFHADFYCIEKHKEEVACNGVLFDNIYTEPSITPADADNRNFSILLDLLEQELLKNGPSDIVLKAFLQLLLAKSSEVRADTVGQFSPFVRDDKMELFRKLLEERYRDLRKPGDYAALLRMSPNNFRRRCLKYFKKTPSRLIAERIILAAKQELHLTRKSIKEIAYTLKFEDQFYFSRMFKKHTRVSPQIFRDKTGISVVADLSKE